MDRPIVQCGIGGNLAFEESATRYMALSILCYDNVTGIFKVFSLVPNCPSPKCPDVNCRGKDFSPCLSIFFVLCRKVYLAGALLFCNTPQGLRTQLFWGRWPTYNHDH